MFPFPFTFVAPTASTSFESVNSFSFDGIDAYINCNTGEIGNVDVSTSYWIKTTASGTYVPMWSVGLHAVGSANSSFGRYYFNGSGNLFVAASSNYGTTIINDGNWHHIVETYTASSKTKYIYVDGNTTAEATSSLPGWWNAPTYRFQGLVLGTYTPTHTTYMFEGNLDEVALWTSVLSSAAITEIYNSGVPNDLDSLSNASSPTHWYRMGEEATFSNPGGTGNWTLTDQGTGGADATSVNMEEADKTTDVPT